MIVGFEVQAAGSENQRRLAISRRILLIGAALLPVSACGGGSPMRVEQRFSEPKSREQILEEKAAMARQDVRSQGDAL